MGSLSRDRISRIAIIGAGPAGISTAKYLLAERAFKKIDIFEQRGEVGGLWNLTPNFLSSRTPIPQVDPNYQDKIQASATLREGFSGNRAGDDKNEPFETALYDTLETNVPKQLMQYADRPFADHLPLFPRHESVLNYCKEYSEDVKRLIHFNCQVSEVRPAKRALQDNTGLVARWSLTTTDAVSSKKKDYEYDAVVIANGHYSVPYVPRISGLEAWSLAYPDAVTHSKAYRNPANFAGKKVIVVGNSISGLDIGAQIAQVCRTPVLQSSRTEIVSLSPGDFPWKEDVAEIVEFMDPGSHNRSLRFADGRMESDIDYILFATGYLYSFPFLNIHPPIVLDGFRTRDIYQQLFHVHHPTLAFPLLPQKVIPFPLAENQAAVIARVWSRRLDLPSLTEMRAWEDTMLGNRGDGKAMHVLNFPEDADYLNMLYDWAASAWTRQSLENDGRGRLGTRWDAKQRWLRSQFPVLKKAYAKRGEGRLIIKTAEELGFDFEEFKVRQEEDADRISTQTTTTECRSEG